MQVWTMRELFKLTRTQLFALHYLIVAELPWLDPNSLERDLALANLRNIRRALAHPRMAPG
jgi:hypothetical protein